MNHLKPIYYKTIPNAGHRYPTVGDYWETENALEVRVSEMPDRRHEQLVLIHELVEIFLLQNRGVTLKDTDDFDIMFEKERAEGKHSDDAEPGDDPRCPYRNEHRFAENMERMLAHQLGIEWEEYNATVMAL
ncbi:hypothetical protein [Caballeronia sp.]|uniref:hypothetical protein n=1 Tax=Caballeronia sp. TaxID=1931223 RepID=UPI003C331D25